MSLQDIKHVLSKIISLNKNLDENRLNNLLEAGGWEKQNKEEALAIFKNEKKKINNLIKEENKEISTEVIHQELSVETKKDNVMNFIPANLPIKEEELKEVILADNKVGELSPTTKTADVSEVKNIIPEVFKKEQEITEVKNQENPSRIFKEINWVPILAIIIILLLLAFGYMYSHNIL